MEKVNDKIRKFRFFQNKFEKKCARCAFFENVFTEKLFFFFAYDFLSLDGGEGEETRGGALCILISNACERNENKLRAAFELVNTVVGVRPNLKHM